MTTFKRRKFTNSYEKEIRERKRIERANTMLAFDCFRTLFDRFHDNFKTEGFDLLKQYAEKVISNPYYYTEKTVKYAENLIKFLNSWKIGQLNVKAGASLNDEYEWGLFCCGALRATNKEHLYDRLCW